MHQGERKRLRGKNDIEEWGKKKKKEKKISPEQTKSAVNGPQQPFSIMY